jgi:clan AA aspartic protease
MGSFSVEITLRNARDVGNAKVGIITEQDIRHAAIMAVVDTGASTMALTEDVCRTLGLEFKAEDSVSIASGERKPCKRTEPVEITWKNRSTDCSAIVIPGSKSNLLGAIPLEGMDLKVNPVKMCLEGANGDTVVHLALYERHESAS